MKKPVIFCLLIACIGFQSCKNDEKKKEIEAVKAEGEKVVSVQCYKAIYEKDTIDLKVNTLKNGKISGDMIMKVAKAPIRTGEVAGEFKGDTLFADYHFTSGKNGREQYINPIALLHKGDKAKFIIPYQLAYGEQGRPPVIPERSDLIFDVEIVDVQTIAAPVKYDVKNLPAKKTASGLTYYEVNRSTSTNRAVAGKTVKVHYSGYLADGKMFDSSVERGEPIEFPLGQGQVIPGWEEGIALMNVGDKLRLVIPYNLAYGESGRPPVIPAKADLTFDVELVDVK